MQINFHFREFAQERGHERHQAVRTEGYRRADPELTARRVIHDLRQRISGLCLSDDVLAALVVGLAQFGQALPARGAIEQPRTQPLFKGGHVFGNHLRRHVEALRGTGVGARFGRHHESRHAGQPIHSKLLLAKVSNRVQFICIWS
ncbi:hypothetical protein D3C81_1703870 [compost metagenome]